MRKYLLAAGTAAAIACSVSANAATYVGTRTVGTATANLSITTDDTIGVLGVANILDYTITLTDGLDNFVLTGPLSGDNSDVAISGTAFTATATDLLFDFSAGGGYALFQTPFIGSSQQFYCVQITGCFDFGAPGEAISANADFAFQRNTLRGSVSLAQISTGAVPEPGTWAMMLIGFGAIGGAMRRRPAVRLAAA